MEEQRDKKEFGKALELRTKNFAVSVIKIMKHLPKSDESRVIKNQIVRSATSVGANYREANRAWSRADFRNKIRISEGEISETVYWLEIIDDLDWIEGEAFVKVKQESTELLAIFSSIIKTMNN